MKYFDVSEEVAILGMSLYLFGYVSPSVLGFDTDLTRDVATRLDLSCGRRYLKHTVENCPS